jgi:SAM-dependent methyltransferase
MFSYDHGASLPMRLHSGSIGRPVGANMSKPDGGTSAYVLGHSDRELERLRLQAQLIDPITRQFLSEAGIAPGMRVLDIGSGAGDVAFLAAHLVGPAGQVVGVDRSGTALARARTRAEGQSLANVTFRESELAAMAFDQPFDAAIGRYVLCFQPDPVSTLRTIAKLVRPGGIILFHEPDREQMRSFPPAPTYDRACQWLGEAYRRSGVDVRIGIRRRSQRRGTSGRRVGLHSVPYPRGGNMVDTPAVAALRSRISDILMSDSCQRIDFRWGPYHSDGWSYTAVALSLVGASRSLRVAVGGLAANQGASYNAETNTLRLPSTNYAAANLPTGANANLGFERMAIVHECTHAVTDQMRRHPTILARSDEVMAFVAESLFNVYEGSPFVPPATDAIMTAAHRIARSIQNTAGAVIGPAADVQALETAITQSPTYSFIRFNPGFKYHNSGLPL